MSQTPPRLYVSADLHEAARIEADGPQAHYLIHVMRRDAGDQVLLFNGRHGEWQARLERVGKKAAIFVVEQRRRVQTSDLDLWLVFAPVKNARIEFVIEKATELGAAALMPVATERTIVRRINLERLRAHAIEAAEQSNRLDVPDVRDLVSLEAVLRAWPAGRTLIYADEIGPASLAREALSVLKPGPAAVLIGPEGGFTPQERARILKVAGSVPISLGQLLLRADTAALTALTLAQAFLAP